jgi:hypothetical protein
MKTKPETEKISSIRADESNRNQTYFFDDLDEDESKEKLGIRFENTKKDFEHYLLSFSPNKNEICLEFVKLMVLAFLPDTVVCCIKIKDEIAAVNVIKEVYETITENNPESGENININALMGKLITVKERGVPDGEPYERKLKDWCWYGFELLRTFLCGDFEENKDIKIEFLLPYTPHYSEEIKKIFKNKIFDSEIIKEEFLKKIDKSDIQPLSYFNPSIDVNKKGFISRDEHKYTEITVEKIEECIEKEMGTNILAWVAQHFQNDEESRKAHKIKKFIRESFGFYMHFPGKRTGDRFKKWFEEIYKEGYIFKDFQNKLWDILGKKEQNYSPEEFSKEFDDHLEKILKKEEKPEKIEDSKSASLNNKFKEDFKQKIMRSFEKHWINRTEKFCQTSDIGAASGTRFNGIPEFLVEVGSDYEDPRNKYYHTECGKEISEEKKKHYNDQFATEKFLFAAPTLSRYSVIPIIINHSYWGLIMVIFGKESNEAQRAVKEALYESHRKILSRLREVITYAERGIIAEFESFVRNKLLKSSDKREFIKNLALITKESKKNPLIPDIYIWSLKGSHRNRFNCKNQEECGLYHSERNNSNDDIEVTGVRKLSQDIEKCPRLKKIIKGYCPNKEEMDSIFYDVYPPGKNRKTCVVFLGKRNKRQYSSIIYLTTLTLADFIEVGWNSVLINEEKKSLYTKYGAVAIIMDTFSHNIAAHCLNELGLYFNKKRKRISALKNSEQTIQPDETVDKLSDKWDLLTDDFELEKIKNSTPENAYEKISSLYDYMVNKNHLIENFLKFMRSKSAFWSGAIGEQPPTAAIMDINELLIQFVDNSLFLGSIAASEGIFGVKFFLDNNLVAISHLEGGTFRYHYDSRIGDEKFENDIKERKIQWEKAALGQKPGKFFKDNINRQFFFPNGVIGIQALYTIWENILRNVKHTTFDGGIQGRNANIDNVEEKNENNSDSSKLLPLKVEIKDEENQDGEESSKYLITSYIDVEPGNSFKDKAGEENESVNKNSVNDILFSIKKGIVDKQGKPFMGGTTQMVLCAGFLQGLSPTETHEKITGRKDSYKKLIDVVQDEGAGLLKYTVKVWKGEYYTKWQVVKGKIKDPLKEKIYRFRLIVMENPGEEKDMEDMIRPPIRKLLVEDLKALEEKYQIKDNKSRQNQPDKKVVFEELYQRWLDKWIFEEEIFVSCSVIMKWSRKRGINEEKTEDPEWWQNKLDSEDKIKLFAFFHPTGPEYQKQEDIDIEERHIGFRNHGTFVHLTKKEGGTLLSKNLPELFEVLATRIVIIDDTIYKRFKNLHPKQKDILSRVLNLKIHPEIKERAKLSNIILNDNQEKHFLVIHLSNVETVKEYNREVYKTDLQNFVREVIGEGKGKKGMYRFLVFTSGRNREIDKKNFDDYQKTHSLFIHREEFMQVIEWAEETPIEAAFRIKYGFVKKLIGT